MEIFTKTRLMTVIYCYGFYRKKVKSSLKTKKKLKFIKIDFISQYTEKVLNKTKKLINKTLAGSKSMFQGF